MLDAIGRDMREMALDMLPELETALKDTGINSFVTDKNSGVIFIYPRRKSEDVRFVKIRPLPFARSVEISAIMKKDNIRRYCILKWQRNNRTELSRTIRKLISGG